jgi:hypothetical protein
MSSGRIARHRNYGELMARHEKELRIKKIIKLFMYFLIVVFMVVLFFIVKRVQEGENKAGKPTSELTIILPVDYGRS